jgi:glycosyltransferase involved in cell wall biosynthesis
MDKLELDARVSVVIPVRDRRDLLGRALDALDRQTFRDFSVVIVDDGSTDGSGDMAAGRVVSGRPVTVLRTERVGAVRARQAGVAHAATEILAFTDSDCEPTPNWLTLTVAALDDGAELAHGRTEPAGHVRLLERTLWSNVERLYPSCNLVIRRSAYDAVGGFEMRHANRGSGEDTLLAWRIARKGVVRYVEDAVVHHAVLPFDAKDALHRTWDARDFPALVREVPELRQPPLFRGLVLLGDGHRVPMYVTVLAFVARRRWALLPALVWARASWRGFNGRQGTRRERARALPIAMALDLVCGAALVSGSVRQRSLVL